jgi:glycosyltransferase involved in cell wall biosynthesis
MPLSIGYFIRKNWFPPRAGSAIHAYQIATRLTARGHRLSAVFRDYCDPQVTCYKPAHLPHFLKNIDLIYIRIFGGWELGKFTLLKLLKFRSCPVVWEINGPVEEQRLIGLSRRQVARLDHERRLLARWVDACICNTQVVADHAAERWGTRNNYVVPNGSDPELFHPGQRDDRTYPELEGRFKIVWAGTPRYPWHGLPLLFDVARRMETSDPDTVFILIGNRHFLDRNGSTPKNVHLVDEQLYFDMPRYLASADLGLCLYERHDLGVEFYRSPLKLFDYMSSGLPVVVTSETEIRKIVRNGESGLLVDNDADEIVRAIRQIKNDADSRYRLGQAARQEILRYYNWNRVADQTEAILRSLC